MKALTIIAAAFSLLISMPIWYYLLHWLLVANHAGDLQMFLFWVYVPVGLAAALLTKLIEKQ